MDTALIGISLLLVTFAFTVHTAIIRKRLRSLEEIVTKLWKDR